jgi:hypothetical protein
MSEGPERIWLKLADYNGHPRYVESGDFSITDIGYTRNDIAPCKSKEWVDAQIAYASGLSNRGRFGEAFNVLVHALRAAHTTPLEAHAREDSK